MHLSSSGSDFRSYKCSSNYVYLAVVENDITIVESLRFDLSTVREATDNFSVHNKIGEGGFGEVYKVQSLKVPYLNKLRRYFKVLNLFNA